MRLGLVSRVTFSDSRGHYLTFYETLEEIRSPSETILLAQRGVQGPSRLEVFGPKLGSTHNYITAPMLCSSSFKRLVNIVGTSDVNQLLFYDGALFDFWLAVKIAREFPNIDVFFNFHYAGDWAARLQNKKFARNMLRTLSRVNTRSYRNLFWMAESSKLGQLVQETLLIEVEEFPVFANISPSEGAISREKIFDVLVPPLGRTQAGWDLELYKILRESFPKIRLASQNDPSTVANLSDIAFYPRNLAKNEYLSLVASSRFVALPYGSGFHIWGSSGRFEDALALGCIPVITSNTPMAGRFFDSFPPLPSNTSANAFALSIKSLIKRSALELPKARSAEELVSFMSTRKKRKVELLESASRLTRFNLWSLMLASIASGKIHNFIQENIRDIFRTGG